MEVNNEIFEGYKELNAHTKKIDDAITRNDDEFLKENGLLNPLIVRKKSNGKYEMISGHRRKKALELIGETEVDAYIKDYTDDEAIICMVDSNIYREKILPSEKAFAYKLY